MNFTLLLLIAFAMSMTTQGQMGTTDNMQSTGDMQTSGDSQSTWSPPVKTTAGGAGNKGTTASATTAPTTTASAMATTGGMETTSDDTTETPKATADFEVTTTFKDMDTAKFEGAKANLTAVFADIFGVNADLLKLTFDEPTKAVTVKVTGISKEKADGFKATVEGKTFTDDLNEKITDKGVAGVVSTGSSAKVTENTPKPNTPKPQTTGAPTGSSSALTVLAGLLALLAY